MSGTIEQQEGDSLKWKVPKGIAEIGNLNWQTRSVPISSLCLGHGWVDIIVVVVLFIQSCPTLGDLMDKVLPVVSVIKYITSANY